ncbi:MAG: hypothetical protein AABZ10_14850 [Nitrospirota bacterium]
MLYLYLDESGDLGFDFFAKKPSKYFTVTVLAVSGKAENFRDGRTFGTFVLKVHCGGMDQRTVSFPARDIELIQ